VSTVTNRRQFLRTAIAGGPRPARPPWSLSEPEFLDRCDRCDDCLKACPERILKRGSGGFPEVDFARGGCTFCGECLNACKGRAIVGDGTAPDTAWTLRAEIDDTCLAVRGVVCRSCGEACDARAIRFRLELGGVARPLLDRDRCNGCGGCYSICPVAAVRIHAFD
jgi:ferredoxin-type protein NapF